LIKTRIDLVSLSFSNEIYRKNHLHFNVIKQLQSFVLVICSELQVLNISDNPTKGEDLQVNENIWSIIVPKERTYRRRPSIIRSGT
jgi:hypothetical protein